MVEQFLAVCFYVLVLDKILILLYGASVHGWAHFCPIFRVGFPPEAKLVVPEARKDCGLCYRLLMPVPLAVQMAVTPNLHSFSPRLL